MGGTGHKGGWAQLSSTGLSDLHGQEPVSSSHQELCSLSRHVSRVHTCPRYRDHTLDTNTDVVGAAVVVTRLAADNNNILQQHKALLASC